MDYQRIYSGFIENRIAKEHHLKVSGGYKERHHIFPVSLGGTDDKENLVYLTARDHYFAHCCLAKIHGGKMWSALHAICFMAKDASAASHFIRGRMFAVARGKAAAVRSTQMLSLWGSGEFKRNRVYGPISESHKAILAAAATGRQKSPASIQKQKETVQRNARRFLFVLNGGERFHGTASEFKLHTGLSQSMVSYLTRGKILTAKGWSLDGTNLKATRGRDATERKFEHKDGDVFVGTVYEFRTRFSFDCGVISNLVNGKNRVKSFKGWKYIGVEQQ